MEVRKSRNHGEFIGKYEYFTFNQAVYKAHKTNTIDINTGFRTGGYFECFLRDWAQRKQVILGIA